MSVLKYKDGDEWKSTNTIAVPEEPEAYLKSAAVDGNTLTLTNKDDTTISFTPSGGSGGGYYFYPGQTLTDEDRLHLKEVYKKGNIYMSINNLTVVRSIKSPGMFIMYVVINTNGADSNQVLVYTVDCDKDDNITGSTLSLYKTYYLVGSDDALSGNIITSENWSQYISTGNEIKSFSFNTGTTLTDEERTNLQYCLDNPTKVIFTINNRLISGMTWVYNIVYFTGIDFQNRDFQSFEFFIKTINDRKIITGSSIGINSNSLYLITDNNIANYLHNWQYTTYQSNSSLYNAKELVIYVKDSADRYQMGYFNFSNSVLGDYNNNTYYFGEQYNNPVSWIYNGSYLDIQNCNEIIRIYYKT